MGYIYLRNIFEIRRNLDETEIVVLCVSVLNQDPISTTYLLREPCKYANRFEKLKRFRGFRNRIDSSVHDRRSLCENLHISTKIVRTHTIQWEKKTKSATYVRVLSSFTLSGCGHQMALKASLRSRSVWIKLQEEERGTAHLIYDSDQMQLFWSNLHATCSINKTFFISNDGFISVLLFRLSLLILQLF